MDRFQIEHESFEGDAVINGESSILNGAQVFVLEKPNEDGFLCRFPAGALSGFSWITADALAETDVYTQYTIEFGEGDDGPVFESKIGLYPNCQARIRIPFYAFRLNAREYPREGAFLKPMCHGDVVDPSNVTWIRFLIHSTGDDKTRLHLSPLTAVTAEPDVLTEPVVIGGITIDRFGQSASRQWSGKIGSVSELEQLLKGQLEAAGSAKWPDGFSRWGGDAGGKMAATGYFHVQKADDMWWLVDPDGHPFWSSGPDCVRSSIPGNCRSLERTLERPEDAENGMIDYLSINFRSVFGQSWKDKWRTITLSMLKTIGFNTVANWSEWEIASASGFPYVRDMVAPEHRQVPRIFRDFADVFHPEFGAEAEDFASQLEETRDDRAMIGYFLMNEPQWGFADQVPAEGMLVNTPECKTREEFADFLAALYDSDAGLQQAWGMDVSFEKIRSGWCPDRFAEGARKDLTAFSEVMVDRLYGVLHRACNKVDPNHLDLGARYHRVPPEWAFKGMGHFDVLSFNSYSKYPREGFAEPCRKLNLPAIIGEWHFGALDVGLPASGLERVANQSDRGKAYRYYVERGAAMDWCIGVHWFTYYDQSAIGRYDGEAYNIGFLDICNQPYPEMMKAGKESHGKMYKIRRGELSYFDDPPQYLPRTSV